jgi:alkaline phosphatase
MRCPAIFIAAAALISANSSLFAAPIKNVILMIPDGTSTSVLSLTRWCEWYKDRSRTKLAIDPYICGMVNTHSSNAPIGDSGPTSTWYSTGEPSQTGFIGMYPPKDANDLVPIDSSRAYQPLFTVLEGAKLSGKKTGLVFTCEFPHATPADFSAHWYDRQDYDVIGKQMVHNGIDVVFGGGTKYLGKEARTTLVNRGYEVIEDIARFRRADEKAGAKLWALLSETDLPYDLDRNPARTPSLGEMTAKALRVLSKGNTGFFLLVEGSKIDWAAHANDPVAVISEFAAFDRAVDTAIAFAKKNGETVVVICPDHGTGAISMGNRASNIGYDKLTINQICEPIVRCKTTVAGLADMLLQKFRDDSAFIQKTINKCNPALVLSYPEIRAIINGCNKARRGNKSREELTKSLADIITSRSFIGFSTKGHTGEDVFFAAYDPRATAPTGVLKNGAVNRYLSEALGLVQADGTSALRDSTERYFHRFKAAMENMYRRINRDTVACWNSDSRAFIIKKADCGDTALAGIANGDIVMKMKKKGAVYAVPAYKNYYYVNGEQRALRTVTVWVDKNRSFYLPKTLAEEIR